MNKQLIIDFPVTRPDICTMCHWSSDCDGCCKKCKDQCNAMQRCGLEEKMEDQQERWNTWNYFKRVG